MERNDTHRIRLLRTLFKFSDLRAEIAVGEALNDSSKEVREAAVQIVLFGYGGIGYGIRAIRVSLEQVAQRWWEKNESDLRRRAWATPEVTTVPELPDQDILDVLRRHLAASTPGAQSGAIGAALDFADQAATLVWEQVFPSSRRHLGRWQVQGTIATGAQFHRRFPTEPACRRD